MSNPNSLFLLADHVKLSLLERQRAQSLDLESGSQDGHISRSLEQFRDGLEALEQEKVRLEEAGDENKALNIADAIPTLRKQLDDLTAQFHGFSNPSSAATLAHPNDASLSPDFEHASTVPAAHPSKPSLRTPAVSPPGNKSVRFQDNPASSAAAAAAADAQAAALFNRPYRDEPGPENEGYRDHATSLSNTQIHAYHSDILAQQDSQLDALGESIGRQRELSMQIGDELDSQVAMLEESERATDRHQGRLDRARNQLGRFSRAAGESKQMVAIVVLIIVLVLLIAILK